MALGLVLIAIPLAYVNPRLGNYTAMFYAVLIYLIYSNLLNLTQNFVAQGKCLRDQFGKNDGQSA